MALRHMHPVDAEKKQSGVRRVHGAEEKRHEGRKRIIPKCKSENDVIKPNIAGADYENFK